jgi:hypothetical protein
MTSITTPGTLVRLSTTIAGVALSGVLANSFAFALHEIFGHGLAAQALGGRFLGFFISPTAALAETAVDAEAQTWVSAAGTPWNLLTGWLAYLYLRRHGKAGDARRLGSVALWHFAHVSLVMQLMYVGALPLGMWLLSRPPVGDWGVLFDRLGIHPVIPAAVAIPLSVVAASALAGLSIRLTPWPLLTVNRWGVVTSYLSLTLPPLVLLAVHALIVLPWSESRDFFELQGLAATPLTAGLAGAAIGQRRRNRRTSAASSAPQSSIEMRVALSVTIAMLAALAALMARFGPTISLRRGIAVEPPTADDSFRSPHDFRAELTFTDGRATLTVLAQPAADRGSPYVRRFTQRVAGLGPSPTAVRDFTTFFAERNLGLTNVEPIEPARHEADGWRWTATSPVESRRVRIQIWPAIYSAGSRIVELTVAGAVLESDPDSVPGLVRSTTGATRWQRPDRMDAPVTFVFAVP